ncbi:MAG TPA: proton-conducting transporter membrane subunit [Gammaproteobacteria bacterium]|nr:proton-conducting transporter membrane subunit [Gammaproteobacteria bacterium]
MAAAIWPVVVPLALALAAFLWPRGTRLLAGIGSAAVVAAVAALAARVAAGGPLRYAVGGWPAPAGITLAVDGLGTVFLAVTALVGVALTVYAMRYFRPEAGAPASAEGSFWPLWWGLWAGLNGLFVTGDAFNAYVALEIVGLTAVALVALARQADAVRAALRYLLVSLVGSLLFLLGVALLYGRFGVLDLGLLAGLMVAGPLPAVALAVMTAGLVLKTALFPLHFWLPPAHGQAPAPVSAALSALVIKAGLYLLLRFWFGVFEPLDRVAGTWLLAGLGAVAVVWGSFQALAAERLKLLVAYSTVAQVGYLFLAFPLLADPATAVLGREAVLYLALAHALAKAAAFMAAGTLLWAVGTDRIDDLHNVLPSFPLTTAAFALAGVSLIGLPPTGGFVGKWMLLEGMIAAGSWAGPAVVAVGTFLAAGYVFRVLVQAFRAEGEPGELRPVHRRPGPALEWSALALALAALGMGFLAPVLEPVLGAAGAAI